MKIAAAYALAALAREEVPDEVSAAYRGRRLRYGPEYLIPAPFDPRLITAVPSAVAKAAMETGYAKAFSAIFDANITTFFVGAILYSFGVGPIQGFAVTLMVGILSSFFTAIVVTLVVFEYLIIDRRASVSYG